MKQRQQHQKIFIRINRKIFPKTIFLVLTIKIDRSMISIKKMFIKVKEKKRKEKNRQIFDLIICRRRRSSSSSPTLSLCSPFVLSRLRNGKIRNKQKRVKNFLFLQLYRSVMNQICQQTSTIYHQHKQFIENRRH